MRFSYDVPKIHTYTRLTVGTARGEIGARVVPTPFVDPKKQTPKGTFQEASAR